ncbi:hypothetical protein FJ938_02000 [Mesorhizobium sp. B2-4-14]|uniref:hypothetical protein n=1 Tax=Mesorhizobium sp. B2-4-14 TaxID=2589935 RepID=UPI00112E8E49|nr:hypothetical protein [Mesorhizobium sp. B2-4-14]TPL11524.1 hypothetical protein FJ938_02000 [Mesorhizobium sp. B2-4-14]
MTSFGGHGRDLADFCLLAGRTKIEGLAASLVVFLRQARKTAACYPPREINLTGTDLAAGT